MISSSVTVTMAATCSQMMANVRSDSAGAEPVGDGVGRRIGSSAPPASDRAASSAPAGSPR